MVDKCNTLHCPKSFLNNSITISPTASEYYALNSQSKGFPLKEPKEVMLEFYEVTDLQFVS